MTKNQKEAVQRLAEIIRPKKEECLRKTEEKQKIWQDSQFSWLAVKPVAPATKGALGKEIVREFCRYGGLNVTSYKGKGADLRVDDRLVAVKFSLMGEDGSYLFEQIRGTGYDFLFCLGLSPMVAHAWVFPIDRGFEHFKHQHSPQSRWARIRPGHPPEWITPDNPPQWMRAQTGELSGVCNIFREYLRGGA